MIPKYAFEVVVNFRVGTTDKQQQQTKNFETLPAAALYFDAVINKPQTKRAQIKCIIEEFSR